MRRYPKSISLAQSDSVRKGTGAGRVYAAIKERILTLDYRPGMDLEEGALSHEFGLSRTPIREAFIRLSSEKLVTILPNRGARVADLSLNSVRQFFEALSLTQRAVQRWAALRSSPDRLALAEKWMLAFESAAENIDASSLALANREFHLAIGECSENSFIAGAYGELLNEGMRLSRLAVLYNPPKERSRIEHLGVIIRDHRATMDAIRCGDAHLAEEIGKAHAELFRSRIVDYIQSRDSDELLIDDASK